MSTKEDIPKGAVTYTAIFFVQFVSTPLRDKLHESLPNATYLAMASGCNEFFKHCAV